LEELAKAVSVVEQLALSPESHGLIDDLVLLITEQTAGYTPVLECRTALTKLGPFAPTAKALSGQLDKLIEPFQRGLDSLADQLDPIRELRQRIAIAAKSLQAADDLLERVNHARAATGIDARAIQPAGGCRQSFDELVSAVVSGSLDLPPAIDRPKSIAGRS
jgi:soluble cytochrome b562